jgi:hypothetical protein
MGGIIMSAARAAMKRRRPRTPQQNTLRLLRVLLANLEHTRDAELRSRLERAIDTIKQKQAA